MEFDNSMNTENQPAIADNSETQQATENEVSVEALPEAQQEALEETASSSADGQQTADEGAEQAVALPFLEIKFNKEKKALTADEAKNYAEIGMKYQGVRERLERYATLKGTTVEDFVAGLEAAEDAAYLKSLQQKFGEDEETINKLMEHRNIEKQKTLDNALQAESQRVTAEQESTNQRIAKEFNEMKKDFPELTDFAGLPEEVKKSAYEGMALPYAYLLHKHKESAKIATAEKQVKAAENVSVGAVVGNVPTDFVGDAFTKGLFGK